MGNGVAGPGGAPREPRHHHEATPETQEAEVARVQTIKPQINGLGVKYRQRKANESGENEATGIKAGGRRTARKATANHPSTMQTRDTTQLFQKKNFF